MKRAFWADLVALNVLPDYKATQAMEEVRKTTTDDVPVDGEEKM